MDLNEIKTFLDSSDPQKRMKGVLELRNQEVETAVPLLKGKMDDPEFLVRSFAAMGLGKKQNAESFAALLEMMKFDRDPNVRAEASNSLSLFGEVAAPHLALMFEQDDHWLVRRSILAALAELDSNEELLQVSLLGILGEDQTVKESAIDCLGILAKTEKKDSALEKLLSLTKDEFWRIRWRVAKALGKFEDIKAENALKELKQDADHRVVGAVLELGL
ncbi:MAG: HEAT repeat domain-containing protein [Xenococcaceae cyanobacterium MO_207.B15]|nr:HEAT repeat domain-containing protein [Xenococcaceae cyanobacterium MO_207.B15]